VLTTRLGRVVDRARRLEARLIEGTAAERPDSVAELRGLTQRARLIQWAISAGTVAALLVCLLIGVAFVGYLFEARLGAVVAVLFILAMLAFMTALTCFLREVTLAIGSLRFRSQRETRAD